MGGGGWTMDICGNKIERDIFTQPSPWTSWVSIWHVSVSVCVSVTIFLHILLLTLNYHSPPLYAGIFILLKPLKSKHWRRDQLRPV